jgi:pentatricopeptide repeat protein
MRSVDLTPDEHSYNSAIDACARCGQIQLAHALLLEMVVAGLQPDVISYNSVINACSQSGNVQLALELMSQMKAAGLQSDEISYNTLINVCSKGGQHELAIKLLSDMKAEGLKPNEIGYTAVIDACKNTGNWQLVPDLLQQMKADGLVPDVATYRTAIDALQAGEQYHTADVLYAEVLSRGILHRWSVVHKGMLDFHEYSIGMTLAAMRLVLHDMCSYDTHSDSKHYVHNPATDLVIITGHASSRQDQDGSILQPCIIEYCNKLGILCKVGSRNKGRLIITAAQLQQYIARQQRNTTAADTKTIQ